MDALLQRHYQVTPTGKETPATLMCSVEDVPLSLDG